MLYLSTSSTAFCIRAYFDFKSHTDVFCCLDFYFARAHYKSKRLGMEVSKKSLVVSMMYPDKKEFKITDCNLALLHFAVD